MTEKAGALKLLWKYLGFFAE